MDYEDENLSLNSYELNAINSKNSKIFDSLAYSDE